MTKRSYKTTTPRNRAVRMRHMRRRLYLQDGVLSVRFIKFINEPEPAPKPFCGICDREIELRDMALLEGRYFCRHCTALVNWPPKPQTAEDWAASLDMPSPPWPGGAA